tara:strand:- start:468 stop:692 length:225 start_codon:yes stop_codon:yes gene_type:complete
MSKKQKLSEGKISEVIELAWCDKTSFEMIQLQTNFSSDEVKRIMRENLKPSSYRLWRDRVTSNKRKNGAKNNEY